MVRENYNGRCQMLYFRSEKERQSWIEAAKKSGESTSKYILEMAALGQAKRDRPHEDLGNAAKLRAELGSLRRKNQDLEAIRENYEAEILKLRHRIFLRPKEPGAFSYSKELVAALQSGGIWPGHEILKTMNIKQSDSEAVEIVIAQLRDLESFGLVEESIHGWRWLG